MVAAQTQYIWPALRFAFVTTAAFFVLLLFNFEWRSAVLAGLTLSIILTLAESLTMPLHAKHNSTFQIMASISSLFGYWLILYSAIAVYVGGYHPAVLALGILALLIPVVLSFVYPLMDRDERDARDYDYRDDRDERSRSNNDDAAFIQRGSRHQLVGDEAAISAASRSEKPRGRGLNEEFPKPQVVSVVWYWNWVNLLIVALGLVPSAVGGLVYLTLYGPAAITEGIAIGSAVSCLGLMYIVFNR
jgi:hypothetical protein